jgi:hypothetical protein
MYVEYTWKYEIPQNPQHVAWEQELYGTLYTYCLKALNDIQNLKKCSWSNKDLIRLEADPATVCALQSLEQFILKEWVNNLSECHRVGSLGRFEIWRNFNSTNNYILITYNGNVARINVESLIII